MLFRSGYRHIGLDIEAGGAGDGEHATAPADMTEDCVKFWTVYEAAHALQDVTPLITHGQEIVIQLSPENGDVDGNQGITNTSRIVESQGMGSS